MHVTVLRDMAQSLCSRDASDLAQPTDVQPERIKGLWWRRNALQSLQSVEALDMNGDLIKDGKRSHKLLKGVGEI